MTEDSFITSWNISHAKHPHTGTEFLKTNVMAVTSILETNNSKVLVTTNTNSNFTSY